MADDLKRLSLAGGAVLVMSLAGCADIQPEVAFPDPRSLDQPAFGRLRDVPPAQAVRSDEVQGPDAAFERLRAQDQRVANIGFRISTANAALCSEKGPQTGLTLQSALQYSPRLRPRAERAFGLDDRPAVEVVADGSPAAQAGLKPGDIVEAIDGRRLPTPPPAPVSGPDDRPATYEPVQAVLSQLDVALAGGPAAITVWRSGAERQLMLTPTTGCGYDAQVIPGQALNASADGRHVFITAALVRYAAADETLALILGHEFAHDVLHHHDRLDRNGFARQVLGDLGSTPASLKIAEEEADYVGLYLTARAGYDISAAPDVWRRFPAGQDDFFRWSHPGSRERAAALAATRDEIFRKIRDGAPLIPTPAPRVAHADDAR